MSDSAKRRPPENRLTLWFVSLLTIILFALGNLPWQLEDYDQAKQAFTSWQIVTSAHFLYQQTPSGKVATKPPLVAWISALLYQLTRSWEMAWRLPSFAAALGLAALLWRRAADSFGAFAGLLAFAAFSFNLLTPRLATLVRTDMPLALVTFLIALLFFVKIRERAPWQTRDRVSLFLLLSAGMLIKGPIIYAFVLPAMVLFFLRFRSETETRSMATGWWPWLASLALFLAWVAGGIKTMPGFYDEVVIREFAGRFGETIHRPQPFYFYIPHLFHKWAPWSLLLIGMLVASFRAARLPAKIPKATTSFTQTRSVFRGLSPELFWLLGWGVGGLLVMSCIPSKRVDRIFPMVPPLCLLLGGMAGSMRTDRIARWGAATLVAAIIFASSYTVFRIVDGFRHHRGALARCAREWQARARENGWRFALLKDDNEALVVYLGLPRFVRENEAVERWNAGTLDTLVVAKRQTQSLINELQEQDQIVEDDLCRGLKHEQHYIVLQRRTRLGRIEALERHDSEK